MHFRISWLTSTLVAYDLIIWRESKERTERKDRTPLLITTVDRWLYFVLSELVARAERVPMSATCPTNVRASVRPCWTWLHWSADDIVAYTACGPVDTVAVRYSTPPSITSLSDTHWTPTSYVISQPEVETWRHTSTTLALSIYVITVSNEVRSAAVNKPVGVEFIVIKVVCILFFCTIGIRTKI